jgi:hypothetical protein
MAIVVIGGHSQNIGKASVVCALISIMAERRCTAIKITHFGHGVCSANASRICSAKAGDDTCDPLTRLDHFASSVAASIYATSSAVP